MKNFLFLLAMLPIVLFTACSSDDDNVVNSPIVGTWTTSDGAETAEITFRPNGSVTENSTLKWNGDMKEYVGSYSVNDGKLTINWEKRRRFNSVSKEWSGYTENKETVVITFSIKDNAMTFLSMRGETLDTPTYYTKK